MQTVVYETMTPDWVIALLECQANEEDPSDQKYLAELARSTLVDLDAYDRYLERCKKQAQSLPELPAQYASVATEMRGIFSGPIPHEWEMNQRLVGYSKTLRHFKSMWSGTQFLILPTQLSCVDVEYLTTELELSSGPLGQLFDSFYLYCASQLLSSRRSLQHTPPIVKTQWRRGAVDSTVSLEDGMSATRPDGRLVITDYTRKGVPNAPLSMVRVRVLILCVCVRVCKRACARVCVRACVCVRVRHG